MMSGSSVGNKQRTSERALLDLLIDDEPFVAENTLKSGPEVRLVDLFAGIGGFHYGVGAAAAKRKMRVEPVLVSELEESCRVTYERNHHCSVAGDINKIALSEFRNHEADIVTAGFPCQPFSNSGRKLGLQDPRGKFYDRIEEIILHFQAKAFILENVPGMTRNGGNPRPSKLADKPQLIGRTMQTLESKLSQLVKGRGGLSYHIRWFEVDSSALGSPQVRKRVYIVGVRSDLADPHDLDFIQFFPRSFAPWVFADIADSEKVDNSHLALSSTQTKNVRSFMSNAPSYKDGMRRVGQAYLCKGGNVGQAYHALGMVPTLTKIWARFLPIYFPTDAEPEPAVGDRNYVPDFRSYGRGHLRRASVREVMLLQGFPKSFIPHETDRVAYEHAGNAVNAKVVREIAQHLLDLIK